MKEKSHSDGALAGYRVLELGSTVAGPFCGRLLADFGAEVVKVEMPSGDPVRAMGKHLEGTSLYAASIFRNKRLIAVDLSHPSGQALIRKMVPHFDILIENFRPGTMEKWGLGYDELKAINPGLVVVSITGFGQSGPYRERPGYGFLGDAASGFLSINGYPDRPPMRAAVPVTDMLTALYGAYGAMMALLVRQRTGRGQQIDAALYESAFSLMESHVPAFDKLRENPRRVGSRLPGSTPNNLYPTKNGEMIAIAAASDSVFRRLAHAMGRPELLKDERFATAMRRTQHEDEVDEIVRVWTEVRSVDEIESVLHKENVPASRVFSVEDIFNDPHYRARKMLVRLPHDGLGEVTVTAPVPKLSETPGVIRWSGGRVGQDTRSVLAELGLTPSELANLEEESAIYCDGAAAEAKTFDKEEARVALIKSARS